MYAPIKTSHQAVIAFFCGLLSVASGLFAIITRSDLFLVGIPVFWGLAVVLGIRSRRAIRSSSGQLGGKGMAAWGMGVPFAGVGLGFLLLPAT